MLKLTRRYKFSAAHKLWNSALTDEENRREFGACVNLHGHNYALDVTIGGVSDPKTGMILSLVTLDELVRTEILAHVDHTYLDADVAFLKGTLSTVENVVGCFYQRLKPVLPAHVQLCRVRLYESDTNWADYEATEECV